MWVKDCVIGTLLMLSGIACLYFNNDTLAAVCFGALTGYAIKNGYNNMRKRYEPV